jgi:hypothetical protein
MKKFTIDDNGLPTGEICQQAVRALLEGPIHWYGNTVEITKTKRDVKDIRVSFEPKYNWMYNTRVAYASGSPKEVGDSKDEWRVAKKFYALLNEC